MKGYGSDAMYAHDRLSGSYVMCNGSLFSVMAIKADGRVLGEFLNGVVPPNTPSEIRLRDLDLSTIPLGYFNSYRGASYLSRRPLRQWKQGLRYQNLHAGNGNTNGLYEAIDYVAKGIYPKYDFCLETLFNEECPSVAFARRFAVAKKPAGEARLLYKDRNVGRVMADNGELVLDNKFFFLKETLEEAFSENN